MWRAEWRGINGNALTKKGTTMRVTTTATMGVGTIGIGTGTATSSDAMVGDIMWTEMHNGRLFPLAAMACFSAGCAAVDASANF
jgi:hypothetical protein